MRRPQQAERATGTVSRFLLPQFKPMWRPGGYDNKMRLSFCHVSIALTTLMIVCMISCKSNSGQPDTAILLQQRDSLFKVANENQQEVMRMTTFFNEVAACLDSISEQEKLITSLTDSETRRRYSRKEITQRLNQLSEIIVGQRKLISSLLDSLNNKIDTAQISGLRSTITFLTVQLEQKEKQIQRLKIEISGHQRNIRDLTAKVEGLNNDVNSLTEQNNALTEAVELQTQIINEGYVLIASKQQLKQMGVIEGGFLKKTKVHIGKIDKQSCNKVDISSLREIPINSRKIKLLSPAPQSSYTIRTDGSSTIFTITDATAFWSISNVLVIQIQ